MASVRSLRVSVKSDSASDRSESDSESESDRDAREAEPMEVDDGELESISVNRSLKELLPDTSRRYENKAGTFITGIDVTSKEAIEKKEKRARRFHFRAEENLSQRNVILDREVVKEAIPKVRLEALLMSGVDDMSTQDIFGYFKEYPPAHIEWIDDTSCNVVWLDDITPARALINLSRMPDKEEVTNADSSKPSETPVQPQKAQRNCGSDDDDDDEEEGEDEGEVDDDDEVVKADKSKSSDGSEGKASEIEEETEKTTPETTETDLLSQTERESLFRNDPRPTIKPFKGNKLLLRFATYDDKKELGAARRSRYYMKYGNPNYGGMKGILSNSWKRRYHTRRIQRDVLKTKKSLIGDSMGHTPPYTHRHSADLVNLPEEPITEEEEEEDDLEEDMDADDRVVEYRERGDKERGEGGLRSRLGDPSPGSSDSDEMDYDLELKMISTPSPKKSMKMTMYADEVETNLRSLRNSIQGDTSSSVKSRIGSSSSCGGGDCGGGGSSKSTSDKVTDVRQLLEEKRQGLSQPRSRPPVMSSSGKTDVRQRLGKRPHSPERQQSVSPIISRSAVSRREPLTDVRSRLGVAKHDSRGLYSESSKDKKTGSLWSRLGPSHKDGSDNRKVTSRASSSRREIRRQDDVESDGVDEDDDEEDDSQLQKMWGAMIKQKEQQSNKMKKSRLDNLPSLQIEISRDSSNSSDSDS
ncbi:nuclear cap-binding protein subunit 3-like [Xyrauchen texanus]|uniref:nuclear cap-binding protein subunit 3-like n=1 Tax=Xyrauchen texanus TaxID=154827 RepID=UPI002241889B|nr:nuclear cap-binding protein subunit 3-like [Xyrauchen texanus]